MTRIVGDLEARTPRDARLDFGMRFRRNGQPYVGPLALRQAREALDEVETTITIANVRRALPSAVIASAGLAAGLSVLILLVGFALAGAGCASRDASVRRFSLVRRILPATLAVQVLLAAVAFVAAVALEAAALLQPGRISGGEIKMLGLAAVAILATLWVAGSTVFQLRRTLAAFEPDPLAILGRTVSRAEAPGLWGLLDNLAERLGALRPDNIVVGLTEGFFVSSGPKVLQPGGTTLAGRTLYLPLPYLPLLRPDEVVSIIGHELAHFSGGDTEYSQRFLPIYAGVERSLEAVASAGSGTGAASPLLSPALGLGVFVMDQFHHAVRHWSRRREFAADAAGAGVTSAAAAARALLRTSAIQPRIVETLDAAAEAPDAASSDRVSDVVHRAATRGLDDPTAHLEEERPHPTDTHPPTRQRIVALGLTLGPDLMAAASARSAPSGLVPLVAYFADPTILCRTATADFLTVVRRNAAAAREHLEATAAKVGTEERVLHDGTRSGAVFIAVAGVLFLLAAPALAAFGLPGLSFGESGLVASVAGAIGLAFLAFGAIRLRRGERAFLILRPEELVIPGFNGPISWDHVADFDVTMRNTRMVTRFLLPPDAPFPERPKGSRGLKLDRKRHIVTMTAVLPQGMKPQEFADLLGRYHHAAAARRLLVGERIS